MTRRYFGTDGIRGRANEGPITPDTVLRLALAAGAHFRRGSHRHRAVIGKDTRLSGYMLEPALTAGLTAMGMDVMLVGPLPTPAVSMLTKALKADVGVMISASHNPFEDNGIKLFGPDGYKLSDAAEEAIEALMDNGRAPLAPAGGLGRATRLEDARGRYIEFAKRTFPSDLRLDGLKIVVDCANGAAYRVAPTVLWELGAEVIPIAVTPDGKNINARCGATQPATLSEAVVQHQAHLGVALDGDADRVVFVDENGSLVDGDQIMALIAGHWRETGALRGPVVATVMSNLGLERHLEGIGVGLARTPVGDRHVVERMRADNCNVGGEQSGHIILADHGATGDGIVAALQVLAVLIQADRPLSRLAHVFDRVPQLLRNVRYQPGARPLEAEPVRRAIEEAEARLGASGRLVIRRSGTEPLIRVMAEGDDSALVETVVARLCDEVRAAAS